MDRFAHHPLSHSHTTHDDEEEGEEGEEGEEEVVSGGGVVVVRVSWRNNTSHKKETDQTKSRPATSTTD